jgi:hypothetical protein
MALLRLLRVARSAFALSGVRLIIEGLVRGLPFVVNVVSVLLFFLLISAVAGLEGFGGALHQRCSRHDNASLLLELPPPEPGAFCGLTDSAIAVGALNCSAYDTATVRYVCRRGAVDPCAFGLNSYDTVGQALFNAFKVSSLEGWSELSQNVSDSTSVLNLAYFAITVVVVSFLCLNMTTSVMVAIFSSSWEQSRAAADANEAAVKAQREAMLQHLDDSAAGAVTSGHMFESRKVSHPGQLSRGERCASLTPLFVCRAVIFGSTRRLVQRDSPEWVQARQKALDRARAVASSRYAPSAAATGSRRPLQPGSQHEKEHGSAEGSSRPSSAAAARPRAGPTLRRVTESQTLRCCTWCSTLSTRLARTRPFKYYAALTTVAQLVLLLLQHLSVENGVEPLWLRQVVVARLALHCFAVLEVVVVARARGQALFMASSAIVVDAVAVTIGTAEVPWLLGKLVATHSGPVLTLFSSVPDISHWSLDTLIGLFVLMRLPRMLVLLAWLPGVSHLLNIAAKGSGLVTQLILFFSVVLCTLSLALVQWYWAEAFASTTNGSSLRAWDADTPALVQQHLDAAVSESGASSTGSINGVADRAKLDSIWTTLLAMFIVATGESWDKVLEATFEHVPVMNTGALIVIAWYIMANWIILQLVVAVVLESFGVQESARKDRQDRRLWRFSEAVMNKVKFSGSPPAGAARVAGARNDTIHTVVLRAETAALQRRFLPLLAVPQAGKGPFAGTDAAATLQLLPSNRTSVLQVANPSVDVVAEHGEGQLKPAEQAPVALRVHHSLTHELLPVDAQGQVRILRPPTARTMLDVAKDKLVSKQFRVSLQEHKSKSRSAASRWAKLQIVNSLAGASSLSSKRGSRCRSCWDALGCTAPGCGCSCPARSKVMPDQVASEIEGVSGGTHSPPRETALPVASRPVSAKQSLNMPSASAFSQGAMLAARFKAPDTPQSCRVTCRQRYYALWERDRPCCLFGRGSRGYMVLQLIDRSTELTVASTIASLLVAVAPVLRSADTRMYEQAAELGAPAAGWLNVEEAEATILAASVCEMVGVTGLLLEWATRCLARGLWMHERAVLQSTDGKLLSIVTLGAAADVLLGRFAPAPLKVGLTVLRAAQVVRLLELSSDASRLVQSVKSGLAQSIAALVLIFVWVFAWAVLGTLLFQGRMGSCSDPSIRTVAACTGVFFDPDAVAQGAGRELLPPGQWHQRLWSNPQGRPAFDSIADSLITLVSAASLESWIPGMMRAMDAGPKGTGPQADGSWAVAVAYYVGFIVTTVFAGLGLFAGIVVNSLDLESTEAADKPGKDADHPTSALLRSLSKQEGALLTTKERECANIRSYIVKFAAPGEAMQRAARARIGDLTNTIDAYNSPLTIVTAVMARMPLSNESRHQADSTGWLHPGGVPSENQAALAVAARVHDAEGQISGAVRFRKSTATVAWLVEPMLWLAVERGSGTLLPPTRALHEQILPRAGTTDDQAVLTPYLRSQLMQLRKAE